MLEEQTTPPVALTFAAPIEVALKFIKMEEGEDIIVYLDGFEAHQTIFCVNQTQRSVRLASLLPAEVLAVLQSMKKEDQRDYLKVMKKLFKYFHVSQMTFSRMIDELKESQERGG